MSESRDVQSVIEDAEKAATAGDYIAAEGFLRDAAELQEATLGPLHPDLANTLNNLAVVYETLDRPGDAERCYRRAYAIAITSLEPDHPLVATSEKNYRDFCTARGIAFVPPKPVAKVEPAPAPLPVHIPELPSEPQPLTPVVSVSSAPPPLGSSGTAPIASRPPVLAVAGGLGLVALVAVVVWFSSSRSVEAPEGIATSQNAALPETVASPPVESAAPARKPATVAAGSIEGMVANKPEGPRNNVEGSSGGATPRPAATRESTASRVETSGNRGRSEVGRATATSASAKLTVNDAELCSDFSTRDWRCRPAGGQVDSGRVFFYTRIKSPEPTIVEHRWYRGDSLHRVVAVRIQANERSGFRSYSGTAVKQGNWRVELRTRDGSILHEEKFVVR